MCGITGIYAFNEVGRMHMIHLQKATNAIAHRGPDDQGTFIDFAVAMGHRRLSIIDTSDLGHQPMSTANGRYTIVYNGEVYNYLEIRADLIKRGFKFHSHSDTEVVLNAYAAYGESFVDKLNGFFSVAIYDKAEKQLTVVRDRLGIKPLFYYQDEDKFIFSSEIRSILAYQIEKEIDFTALKLYFEFNYIPYPRSIIKGVKKLEPGHVLTVKDGKVEKKKYYSISIDRQKYTEFSYSDAQIALRHLLEESVEQRLIADVPIGTFLSGGIDSSVISSIAAKNVSILDTFSIGFPYEPYYDETSYAQAVAKKIGSRHTVFNLTNDDLFSDLEDIISAIDEPFADSSAIPVNILSKRVANSITVALSGDGADEIFSGYNKHEAWLRSLQSDWQNSLLRSGQRFFQSIPKSRAGKLGNIARKLEKYSQGLNLNPVERYWTWAQFAPKSLIDSMFTHKVYDDIDYEAYTELKGYYTDSIKQYEDFNDFLISDGRLVLTNDMLTKVDTMSMANGLEVRVPFLNHDIVDFAYQLPQEFKIDGSGRKRILRDAYQADLPEEIYQRGKHGFEVPLLKWFRHELKSDLDKTVFNEEIIREQGIFDYQTIKQIKRKLHSKGPGDSHWTVWALYVFQNWYKRYF